MTGLLDAREIALPLSSTIPAAARLAPRNGPGKALCPIVLSGMALTRCKVQGPQSDVAGRMSAARRKTLSRT